MSHDLYLKRLRALRLAVTKPPAEAAAEIQRVMTEAADDGCIDPKKADAVSMAVTLAGIAGRAAKKGGSSKAKGRQAQSEEGGGDGQ